ncbi:hypothetical protein JDV02_008481 [Purpureocillium takamizusanense]|uniref:CFEM domain-containing protein n=1 Tax=Purpureocillium takamizusanense TaxID=2060973 RepID=A0A9Q8VDC7_9HYPO|nr:uncharacterized protein JDV02_008481 [Purpureocillium takamizusanense]UNI22610.1 hypothetical protein JDV02_008481 [Purpureocillium takamizusanense]
MKFAIALAALVSLAAANTAPALPVPKCSESCIRQAMKDNGCKLNVECACQKFNELKTAATPCVIKACGQEKAIKEVLPAVKKMCNK